MKMTLIGFSIVLISGCSTLEPALWIEDGTTSGNITVESRDLDLRSLRLAVTHRCNTKNWQGHDDDKAVSIKLVDVPCEHALKVISSL